MTITLRSFLVAASLQITLLASSSSAAPAQVILIRHGEKPAEGNKLNRKGEQRAQALVDVFKNNAKFMQYGPAAAIYAQRPKDRGGSIRPIQTVTPLARSLDLTINTSFLREEQTELAEAILSDHRNDGKLVVICWEHKAIPYIVQAFGYQQGPSEWGGKNVYDRAWVLTFHGDQVESFADLPEQALPGDSVR